MAATAPDLETLIALGNASADDTDDTELDVLDVRALSSDLTVIEDASMLYRVESEQTDGTVEEYVVEPEYEACTCPHKRYRESECKHIRRVRMHRAAEHDDDTLDLSAKHAALRQTIAKLSELQDAQPPGSAKRAFLSAAQDRLVKAIGTLADIDGGDS